MSVGCLEMLEQPALSNYWIIMILTLTIRFKKASHNCYYYSSSIGERQRNLHNLMTNRESDIVIQTERIGDKLTVKQEIKAERVRQRERWLKALIV